MIATLAGGTWTALTAPEAGLDPPPAANPLTLLKGVSCAKPGMCAVVGDYVNTSDREAGLTETLNDGTWTPAAVPGPADGLFSVACPASGSCVAVGDGFFAALSGGSWESGAPPPNPSANPTQPPYAQSINSGGIACPTASSCVAVGYYEDTAGAFHGLIERQETVTTSPTTR